MKRIIIAAAIAAAPGLARAGVAIEDVTLRGVSQIDGNVYPLDQMPKDDGGTYQFGGDLDVVVGVLISATDAKNVSVDVGLRTPGHKTKAGGKVRPLNARLKRSIFLTAGSKRWLLFVFEYPCDAATFTVKAGGTIKTVSKAFVCPV